MIGTANKNPVTVTQTRTRGIVEAERNAIARELLSFAGNPESILSGCSLAAYLRRCGFDATYNRYRLDEFDTVVIEGITRDNVDANLVTLASRLRNGGVLAFSVPEFDVRELDQIDATLITNGFRYIGSNATLHYYVWG